jgi:hypothetical protein
MILGHVSQRRAVTLCTPVALWETVALIESSIVAITSRTIPLTWTICERSHSPPLTITVTDRLNLPTALSQNAPFLRFRRIHGEPSEASSTEPVES